MNVTIKLPDKTNMRRHLRMVHRLVKVGEVLDHLNEVCISTDPPSHLGN